jgi:hypothetical protein
MHRKAKYVVLLAGVIALVLNFVSYAQEHDHSAHGNQPKSDAARAEEKDIFCPTMKTGQLCSNGTTNVLGLTGASRDKWMTLTRKYNKAVDAATLELFKDAEGVLNPDQLALLKAWFAVGLNPQINQILNDKGLGAKK